MNKEVISVLSVVCILIISIWRIFAEKAKKKALETQTKADDIAIMIAEFIIPIIEKWANDNNIKDKQIIKEIAQNEVKVKLGNLGQKVSDNIIAKAVDKAIEKQTK